MLAQMLLKHFVLFALILVQALYLSACSNLDSGTVFQSQSKRPIKYGEYKVQQGDSLYSIAWRFKRDYKELAAINGIKAPYIIHIGQSIKLASYQDEIPSKNGFTGQTIVEKSATTPSPNTSRVANKKPSYFRRSPHVPNNARRSNASSSRSSSISAVANNSAESSRVSWYWPANGEIIQTFSSSSVGKKGIQISGNAGDPIKAAADGQVVYSGNSLVGYGNLVIVKHNETYLTAYAHNRRVLVKEGELVKQGQAIAEMGSSGTDRNKLHFEIRKEGEPVNPMLYLPKR